MEMNREAVRFREEWKRLQRRQDRMRQIVAIHEASHCVLATHFGFAVHRLSIVPANETLGHCSRETTDYKKYHSVVNEIVVLVAGSCGETLITRRGLPSIEGIAGGGGRSDHEKAWRLVLKIMGGLDADTSQRERLLHRRACRSFLNYQISRAYYMIRSEPFRTVALALANELLGWNELSGDEAREIMQKSVNSTAAHPQKEMTPACQQNPAG